LVDAVGELGAWWGAAHIAFVGGSLGKRGGQNMIEPAAFGAAVSFGPNTQNFRDIVAALLAVDAAVVVHDGDELTAFVRQMLANRSLAEELGRRGQRLVASQLGATARTLDLLATLMAPSTQNRLSAAA
jgi:3-deoxy-D-manno-octulosonic-acid transferase